MTRAIALSAVLAMAMAGSAVQAQPMGQSGRGMGPMQPGMNRGRMDSGMNRGPMGPGPINPGVMPTMEFVRMAMQSDRFEREAGMMAARRGRDPRVRQFGQRMIRDHLRTAEALTRALQRSHMRVPPTPQLDPQQRQMLEQDRGAPARDFDRVYIDGQVQAHQMALQMMQGYASGGSDPAIRRAAEQAVAIIQKHLRMAQEIQGSLGTMGPIRR